MSRKANKEKRQEKIQSIIEKATEAFAEKGFSGVSTNEIADLAGFSKRSMYYYMGDKDTLYESVIREILKKGEKLFEHSVGEDLTPAEQLRNLIGAISKIGGDYNLNAIILRELIARGGALPKYFIPESIGRIADLLEGILAPGEKTGEFKRINPVVGSVMLLSFFVFWMLLAPHLAKENKHSEDVLVFGENVSDSLVDEVYEMFVAMLRPGKSAQKAVQSKPARKKLRQASKAS